MNSINNISIPNFDTSQAKNIANNLKILMEINNCSESEIARALNTSIMTIRRIMSGETEDPRISTLNLIANYFNVTLDSLLVENNAKSFKSIGRKFPQFIPILNWEVLAQTNQVQEIDLENWKDWYAILNNKLNNKDIFAIESKPSMQPRFRLGTLFIINPHEAPVDGDIILVKIESKKDLSLRELTIDSPEWILQPLVSGSEPIYYKPEEHIIIGVVELTLLHSRN